MTTDGKRQHTSSWFYMAMMKWPCPSHTHKFQQLSLQWSLSLGLVLWWIPSVFAARGTRASEEKGCCVIVRLRAGARGLEEGVPEDSNTLLVMSYLLLLLLLLLVLVFCRRRKSGIMPWIRCMVVVVEMSWPSCDSVLWTGGLVPRRQGMMVIPSGGADGVDVGLGSWDLGNDGGGDVAVVGCGGDGVSEMAWGVSLDLMLVEMRCRC